MKYSSCVLIVVTLVTCGCRTAARPHPIEIPARVTHLRVKPADGSAVRRVGLEDYVRAASLSEFAPPTEDPSLVERMLEVQAVIARTYAVAHRSRHRDEGYDLCATTHCQLYQPARLKTSTWAAAARAAAARTDGMVLWHGNAPARAVFHADCGGHTSASSTIWSGGTLPYLVARRDDGPADGAHTSWTFETPTTTLVSALNSDNRTRVGRHVTEIRVTARDTAGRATRVTLKGTRTRVVRGEDLRAVLARAFGPKSVRSTRFEVVKRDERYIFTGRGYGHGVGLCQAGALARLRAGEQPERVLARYFPGTRLVVLR